ncbi:MAG: PKD domain-containing protein [Pseudomonadota bacterium]|nr:PKD domain-containing protein [Pseudomonadota bacterium]
MNRILPYLPLAALTLLVACDGSDPTPDRATNQPPSVSLFGPTQVLEGETVTLRAEATDADGSIEQLLWRAAGGTASPVDAQADGTLYRFTAPDVQTQSTIVIEVEAVDDAGDSAQSSLSISVLDRGDATQAPVVSAGEDQQADEGVDLELFGSATARGGRSIRRLRWEQVAGPSALISAPTDQNRLRLTTPQVDRSQRLTFRFTAEDSSGFEGQDTVDIEVFDVIANALPMVDAGDDQTVDARTTVTLGGTATDPDGTVVSVQWRTLFEQPAVTLEAADTLEARFVAPAVAEQTALGFALIATDDAGAQSEDQVTIHVIPVANAAPSIEDALADPSVGYEGEDILLSASVTDPDADPLTLTWEQIAGEAPNVAIRDADSSQAGIRLPALDGETRFRFRISASDGLASASREVELPAMRREAPPPDPLSCLSNPLQRGCPLGPAADLLNPADFALCLSGPTTPGCPFSELILTDPDLLACVGQQATEACTALIGNLVDPSYLLERIPPDEPTTACNPLYEDGGFEHYVGAVHEHTGYSDGTINTRPADVFAQVAERGFDFAISTEHSDNTHLPLTVTGDCASELLLECLIADDDDPLNSLMKWQATADQVDAATTADFTAIRGFEWTSDRFGHINVLFSEHVINAKTTPGYAVSMLDFWQWLMYPAQFGGGDDALISFNHPGREDDIESFVNEIGGSDPAYAFNGLRHVPGVDKRAVGLEVFGKGSEYDSGGPNGSWLAHALDQGWHVGAVSSEDHHGTDWGASSLPKTVLIARSRDRLDLKEALLARRMYATAQHYNDVRIDYRIDGAPMGSRLRRASGSRLTLTATVARGGAPLPAHIELVTAGNTVLETHSTAQLSTQVTVGDAESYVFLRIRDLDSGRPIAFSSPIWMLPGDAPLPACAGPRQASQTGIDIR